MVFTVCSMQRRIVSFGAFITGLLTLLRHFNLCIEEGLRSRYHGFRKRWNFFVVVLLLLLLRILLSLHVQILLGPAEIRTFRVNHEYSVGIKLCPRGHRCLLFLELYHRIGLGREAKVMLLHHSMMLIHSLETSLSITFRAPLIWVRIGYETAMETCSIF